MRISRKVNGRVQNLIHRENQNGTSLNAPIQACSSERANQVNLTETATRDGARLSVEPNDIVNKEQLTHGIEVVEVSCS